MKKVDTAQVKAVIKARGINIPDMVTGIMYYINQPSENKFSDNTFIEKSRYKMDDACTEVSFMQVR